MRTSRQKQTDGVLPSSGVLSARPPTLTIQEPLGKISTAVAELADKTRAENLAGLFSLNRLAEDLLLPIFRLTLNAPLLKISRPGFGGGRLDFLLVDTLREPWYARFHQAVWAYQN